MAGGDDEEGVARGLREVAGDQRQEEAEGGGLVARFYRGDLVDEAEAEAAAGKPRVEIGNAEGQHGTGIGPQRRPQPRPQRGDPLRRG